MLARGNIRYRRETSSGLACLSGEPVSSGFSRCSGERTATLRARYSELLVSVVAFRKLGHGDSESRLVEAMRACGCKLNNAYMQHSLLALVVIPELRISDVGLIDVTRFEKTEVIVR
ncbi:hypothetical protein BWO90_04355 (plasmid) [Sinorhizobium meliloti]|nr:hypothetical protein BWO90_04355 [Sinorhizobium meliloti]